VHILLSVGGGGWKVVNCIYLAADRDRFHGLVRAEF